LSCRSGSVPDPGFDKFADADPNPDPGCEKFADPDLGLHIYQKLMFTYVKKAEKELWIRIKMRIRIHIQIQGLKKMWIRIQIQGLQKCGSMADPDLKTLFKASEKNIFPRKFAF